jgi:hypothetical protein
MPRLNSQAKPSISRRTPADKRERIRRYADWWSSRSVPLDERLGTVLERHWKGSTWKDDEDLVFANPLTGDPLCMGHSNIQTTMIYADYQPSEHEAEWIKRAFARGHNGGHKVREPQSTSATPDAH